MVMLRGTTGGRPSGSAWSTAATRRSEPGGRACVGREERRLAWAPSTHPGPLFRWLPAFRGRPCSPAAFPRPSRLPPPSPRSHASLLPPPSPPPPCQAQHHAVCGRPAALLGHRRPARLLRPVWRGAGGARHWQPGGCWRRGGLTEASGECELRWRRCGCDQRARAWQRFSDGGRSGSVPCGVCSLAWNKAVRSHVRHGAVPGWPGGGSAWPSHPPTACVPVLRLCQVRHAGGRGGHAGVCAAAGRVGRRAHAAHQLGPGQHAGVEGGRAGCCCGVGEGWHGSRCLALSLRQCPSSHASPPLALGP